MSAGRQDSSTEPRNSARMTDAERQRILVEWNNTCKPYPADKCVHELVEAQAKENPGAVAMAHEGRQLSYQELNVRANQLARLLRQKAVTGTARRIAGDSQSGRCLRAARSGLS
jgi:non-ribosomal peptide synthetase component F